MNPIELWNTTLNPGNKKFIIKPIKKSKEDQDLIYTLMGNDVSLEKGFIVDNAINVSNLDI